MKSLMIKVENEELLSLIEGLQYETESRKEILAYMIDKGMSGTENFAAYQKEYSEYFVQLSTAKSTLEAAIREKIPAGMELRSWNLEFASRQITVDVYEISN